MWSAAFRTSSARWPQGAESVKLAVRESRAERGLLRGHALRRERRPAVAATSRRWPCKRQPPGPARPRDGLAPHVDAQHGQLLRQSKLLPLMARGAAERGHCQPADQHHAAGPPRHLPQAPRHGRACPSMLAAGIDRGLRPRLRDGPLVQPGQRRHAGGGAHGPARGADDGAQAAMKQCFEAVTSDAGEASWASGRLWPGRGLPRRPGAAAGRVIRSRRSGCAPPGWRSTAAGAAWRAWRRPWRS